MILGHNPSEGPMFLFVSQASPHTANPSDPLQTIPEDLQKMEHIQDPIRKSYAAMVRALDRSQKDSPWEGGLRGTALVWSPLLKQRHYVSDHLIHVTDGFSTFTELAGVSSHKYEKRDGNNIWSTLSLNKTPIRREILHNIDPIDGYSSYYQDEWKYVNGTTLNGTYDSWLGDMVKEDSPESFYYSQLVMNSDVWQALNPYSTRILKPNDLEFLRGKTKINCERRNPKLTACEPLKAPCLFNLEEDPCELNNLANIHPLRMKYMKKRVNYFQATALPPANLPAGVSNHKFQKRDGNNIWSTLSLNRTPIRREILHNIDPIDGYSSYYQDEWKYVNGTTLNGTYDSWLGDMVKEDSPESFYYSQL
uniref:Sulfatase N-terminal domain-containing protein n=1 Tax=Phlebotomus papatasi TaxID=29031 RepID=A0A1B0DCQ2_PHLPP